MKIRNGFVSNSSSSSFVVLLPDDFIENVDITKFTSEDDFPVDKFKSLLKQLITEKELWLHEIWDFDKGDWEFEDILFQLLDPYTIAGMDTGPDEGQVILADREKIDELLKNNKKNEN